MKCDGLLARFNNFVSRRTTVGGKRKKADIKHALRSQTRERSAWRSIEKLRPSKLPTASAGSALVLGLQRWPSQEQVARSRFVILTNMKADRVEITRDDERKNWLIRIWVGDEVIRRHCNEPANADPTTLRNAAMKTANDEGYTIDASDITLT